MDRTGTMNPSSMDMDLLPLTSLGTGDLDMDFLEDFMPVSDSFLNSYLQQLESNAAATQQTPGVSSTTNVDSQVPSPQDTTFLEHDLIGDGTGSRDALLLASMPPAVNGNAMGPVVSHALDMSDQIGFLYANNGTQSAGHGVQLPNSRSFVTQGSGSHGNDPNSTGSWDKVDTVSGVHHVSDGQDQNADGYSSGRRKREGNKRVRTTVQQQQNKLAQQRYREKRKQKNSELESKVDQLMSQLSALQEVQGQAAQLSGENTALRNQVTKQQQIIEDLRMEMKSLSLVAEHSTCAGADAICETESCAVPCPTKDPKMLQLQKKLKASTPEEALQHFGDLVTCIQKSLSDKGLPADAFMPGDVRYQDPALRTELSRLVGETCLNCMHLFLSRTICPVEKSDTANPDRFQMIPDCAGAKAKWTSCLDRVKLTPSQEDILLQQRKELLEALRRVYYERNRLNLMAIGMMLPHPSQVLSPCFDPAPDAKIKCMEVNGALYCMRTEKQLNDVLDNLKLNLKHEQKLLMEINYKFVHKVLEPAQAAILMVTAYPSNIDVLALANLLAYRRIHGADDTDIKTDGSHAGASLALTSMACPTSVIAQ